ncbi:putative bifunctional diguanylate cyclase/phosphodiesterase [Rhodococcus sp. 077-4]|uniref:putative bifunctional diguanylate cyclase/phosphodiesterase n=1 Tax=Rhodococcus sp. 077-4 TaxID=2789271 RepID=UPI0039F4C731
MRPTENLDGVVTAISSILMPADADTAQTAFGRVLRTLVEHFGCDAGFLRRNDHEIRASIMVTEWPIRPDAPDPDPLETVYFDDADSVFALAEHLAAPVVFRPNKDIEDYRQRIEAASGHPVTSTVVVPLLGSRTEGVLGLVHLGDRPWSERETNALLVVATMLTQVQARIEAQDSLRLAALHDSLTGLPNKLGITKELDRRLSVPQAADPVTVFFLNFDRLEALNDFHGHAARDFYLESLVETVLHILGADVFLGRWADHEFVALMQTNQMVPTGPAQRISANTIATKILAAVAETKVPIGGDSITRTVSIGVTTASPGVDEVHESIVHADQAALVAKRRGGNGVAFFDHTIRAASSLRNDVELHLHSAIHDGDLVLHYQPEVDLVTGRVTAVEALVRWQHPQRGLLPPSAFLDVAEGSDLAIELGEWVLGAATTAYAQWLREIPSLEVTLSVNVSPNQLLAARFLDTVEHALARSGMDPGRLCLEITEHTVVQDTEQTAKVLSLVRDRGVKVAIDDFGTGFSSLSNLKILPVDVVKIDRDFVQNLEHDLHDQAVVRAVVSLAESFALKVVAEGVESAATSEVLVSMGCTRVQGFFFSQPVEAERARAMFSLTFDVPGHQSR